MLPSPAVDGLARNELFVVQAVEHDCYASQSALYAKLLVHVADCSLVAIADYVQNFAFKRAQKALQPLRFRALLFKAQSFHREFNHEGKVLGAIFKALQKMQRFINDGRHETFIQDLQKL